MERGTRGYGSGTFCTCVCVTAHTFVRGTVSQHTRATLYRWRHHGRRLGPSELNSLSATSLARPLASPRRCELIIVIFLPSTIVVINTSSGRKCPIECDWSVRRVYYISLRKCIISSARRNGRMKFACRINISANVETDTITFWRKRRRMKLLIFSTIMIHYKREDRTA